MTVDTYDIVMLAVLVIATAWGAWKGLAWQVASLAAIFVSYVVAYRFRHAFAAWIPVGAPWNVFLAMLLLYVLSSLGIWIIFKWISKWIGRVKLKEFDRQVGALFGFFKGVVLCVIITLFTVTLLGETRRAAIVNSRSGYFIAVLLSKSHGLMPEEIHELLEPYLRALDDPRKSGAEGRVEQGRSAALEWLRERLGRGVKAGVFPEENGPVTEHKKHYRTLQGGLLARPFRCFSWAERRALAVVNRAFQWRLCGCRGDCKITAPRGAKIAPRAASERASDRPPNASCKRAFPVAETLSVVGRWMLNSAPRTRRPAPVAAGGRMRSMPSVCAASTARHVPGNGPAMPFDKCPHGVRTEFRIPSSLLPLRSTQMANAQGGNEWGLRSAHCGIRIYRPGFTPTLHGSVGD